MKQPHKIHIKSHVDYSRVQTGQQVFKCGFRWPVSRVIPAKPEWPLCKMCERLDETSKESA